MFSKIVKPVEVKPETASKKEFIKVPFNDLNAMEKALKGRDIALVMMEMIPATAGFVMPEGTYLKDVKKLCEKYNATEDQLMLAWILKHPAKIHPVIGTTNKNRIQNAQKAIEIQLELEDWFELLVASQGHAVP